MPGWPGGVVLRRSRAPGWLVTGLAVAGFALLAWNLLSPIVEHGATGASDGRAYWTAARNVLSGTPLYTATVGQPLAFLYPPIVAEAIAPFGLLPLTVFAWGLRGAELLALRSVLGSWRWCGLGLLVFPPLLAEIEAANINLLIAAGLTALLRGDGRWLATVGLPKFSALAAVPYGLVRDRRGTIFGLGLVAGLVIVSIVLDRAAWAAYVAFLSHMPSVDDQFYNVGRLAPWWIRASAAAILAMLAIRRPVVIPLAVVLASPELPFNALSVLVATIPAAGIVPDRSRRQPSIAAVTSSATVASGARSVR